MPSVTDRQTDGCTNGHITLTSQWLCGAAFCIVSHGEFNETRFMRFAVHSCAKGRITHYKRWQLHVVLH